MQKKGLLIVFFWYEAITRMRKKINLGTPGRGYLSAFKEDRMILRGKNKHIGI